MDIYVEGGPELRRLAKAVKDTGDKEMRKLLLKHLRNSVKPSAREIKNKAEDMLPYQGGLGSEVARRARVTARSKLTGKSAGVSIKTTWSGHDVVASNEGQIRHPVFGNRNVWVTQEVDPGWWDEAIDEVAPYAREDVIAAMEAFVAEIAARTRGSRFSFFRR